MNPLSTSISLKARVHYTLYNQYHLVRCERCGSRFQFRHLVEAALEKSALPLVLAEVERQGIGVSSVTHASDSAQQIGAGGMEEVIVAQLLLQYRLIQQLEPFERAI